MDIFVSMFQRFSLFSLASFCMQLFDVDYIFGRYLDELFFYFLLEKIFYFFAH